MMTNEQAAEHIGILAKAEADGSYLGIRNVLRTLTLEDLRMIQKIVADLSAEIDVYERKAS